MNVRQTSDSKNKRTAARREAASDQTREALISLLWRCKRTEACSCGVRRGRVCELCICPFNLLSNNSSIALFIKGHMWGIWGQPHLKRAVNASARVWGGHLADKMSNISSTIIVYFSMIAFMCLLRFDREVFFSKKLKALIKVCVSDHESQRKVLHNNILEEIIIITLFEVRNKILLKALSMKHYPDPQLITHFEKQSKYLLDLHVPLNSKRMLLIHREQGVKIKVENNQRWVTLSKDCTVG